MTGGDRQNADMGLILALAAGATVQDAAGQAGVSERTAHRRLEDADFRRRVAETRSAMFDRAVGKLAEASTEAAETLRALLGAESESVRLAASRGILELGPKLREVGELAQRLEQLEAQLGATSPAARAG